MAFSISLDVMFAWKLKSTPLMLLSAILVSSIVYEIVSSYLMIVMSNFYKTLTEADSDRYYMTMYTALVIIVIITISKSLQAYYCDCCALQWRTVLVKCIHDRLYCDDGSNSLSSPWTGLDNIDQRVSQDVDILSSQTAVLFTRLALLPFVIIYYTWFLVNLLGWIVPLLVLLYFIASGVATSMLAGRLVGLVYCQEQREGDFRFAHVWAGMHRDTTSLLAGESFERDRLDARYGSLRRNKQELLWRNLHLRLCTNLCEYGGAIGEW